MYDQVNEDRHEQEQCLILNSKCMMVYKQWIVDQEEWMNKKRVWEQFSLYKWLKVEKESECHESDEIVVAIQYNTINGFF